MEIKVHLAKKNQAGGCLSCAKHSELWETYFKANATAEDKLKAMVSKKQIYVALNKNDDCVGFMGIINYGCFQEFSYLSIIAVKKEYRSKGVGSALIQKFEQVGFKKADKVFLLVSDYNKRAKLLYKRLGYKKVGQIPDMFKPGISENLLVKYKPIVA